MDAQPLMTDVPFLLHMMIQCVHSGRDQEKDVLQEGTYTIAWYNSAYQPRQHTSHLLLYLVTGIARIGINLLSTNSGCIVSAGYRDFM